MTLHGAGSSGPPQKYELDTDLPAEWMAELKHLAEFTANDAAYDEGCIFNSICTQPHPLAMHVMRNHLHINRGDGRLFPSIARCERMITRILGRLMELPKAVGMCTSGATEANLLAVHSAVKQWRAKGGVGRPHVVMGRGAHFSFDKIVDLLDIELVLAPSDLSTLKVNPDRVAELIGPQTSLIVATAGSSETGAVDDVERLAEIARATDLPLHVDAASGGLLIPFLRELGCSLPIISFKIPGVTSMAIDPHKFGAAPIPAGHLLGRESRWVDGLSIASHYHGTATHSTLLGTSPGASILATYCLLRHQDHAGLRRDAERLLQLREFFVNGLRANGMTLAYQPELMVVGIAVSTREPIQILEDMGMYVSYAWRLGQLRVVIQLHQSEQDLESLVDCIAQTKEKSYAF